ncbi:hypothetical protein SAY87_031668 [Trapa incisa]|uniref:Uncharacterized protein n=1 Tax=Trapa incisa TaxID=236973 RepID=A0AAN7QLW9_9MYRT|nr:hypothetical protein SAY87_031668 [Trapa incisa]
MAGSGGRVIFWSLIRPRLVFRSSSCGPSAYCSSMRCSHQDHVEERAPSTAEEFERMAEERLRESGQQGVAGQTVEKAHDGTEETVSADPNIESVKNRQKEHEETDNHARTGNGDE